MNASLDLKFYIDCDVRLMLCSSEEFERWYNDHKTEKSSKVRKRTHGGCGWIKDERAQFIWVNIDVESDARVIGILAHEASHYVDHLETFMSDEGEKIPGELRARMIETIVEAGFEMLLCPPQ